MPRVRIGPALPDREQLDIEITRLRDLDVGELRNRWHAVFGRPAPAHLPRHLLFRVMAYRLQAVRLGDLDSESQRLLDHSGSPEKAGQSAIYTRVSTDQKLEQDFNSLDAQYDASQAYIRSQAHAGWTLLRGKYDDGGFSGSDPIAAWSKQHQMLGLPAH
jgi:hypothetical protein